MSDNDNKMNKRSPLADIDFCRYLRLEKLWRRQRYDDAMKRAYVKVSSYILNNEQINVARLKDAEVLKDLLAKYKESGAFCHLGDEMNRDCLFVLQRIIEFIEWRKEYL